MWPTISAINTLAKPRIVEYCDWSKHQTLSKLHTRGTALSMHVFMLAHLLIQTDHLLYIPSCTNWVTLMLFLAMHALRGAYQATILAFITSMATNHGICYFQMWSTYWFICQEKKTWAAASWHLHHVGADSDASCNNWIAIWRMSFVKNSRGSAHFWI